MPAHHIFASVLVIAVVGAMTGCMRTPLDEPTATAGQPPAVTAYGGMVGTGGWLVSTGGRVGTGGTVATGGTIGTGGTRTGGTIATGGTRAGGTIATGGTRTGGTVGSGGTITTGGTRTGGIGGTRTGGIGGTRTGGTVGTGGSVATGGTRIGGSVATGGTVGTGGTIGTGGSSRTGGTTGSQARCGDGVNDVGEQCDVGADNEATPAFWITQDALGFAAVPIVDARSAAGFYGYKSDSAHTGFEAAGTSRMTLYLDRATLDLSLVFFHGIDLDSTGVEQPRADVGMQLSGLPEGTAVEVVDDFRGEFYLSNTSTAVGAWEFRNNTDGGVLGKLPLPGDWEITVAPSFNEGISTWTWIQSDGSMVTLDPSQPLTIRARGHHSQCRPDCTAPQCGDGILDGGEVCDDGRPSALGCSTNCSSFN